MICSDFPELEALISEHDEKHGDKLIEEITILASGMLFEGTTFREFLQRIATIEQRTSKIFLVLDHTTTSKNDIQKDLRCLKSIDLKKTSLNISLRHFQFLDKPHEIIGIFIRFFAKMVRRLIKHEEMNEELLEIEEIFEKEHNDSKKLNKKRAHQELVEEHRNNNNNSSDGDDNGDDDSQNTIKTTKKKMISSENYLTKVTSSTSFASSLSSFQQHGSSELLCIQLTKHCHLKLLASQIDLQCKFSSTNEQAIISQLESLIEVIDVFLKSENTQYVQVFTFNLEIPSMSTFLAKPTIPQLIVSLHSKVSKLQMNSQRAYITLKLPQFDFSSLAFDTQKNSFPKQAAFNSYCNTKPNNSFDSTIRSAKYLSDSQQTFNLNYKYQNSEESTMDNNNSIQVNEPSILKIGNKLYLNLLQCKNYFNQGNPVAVDSAMISQVISSWNLTLLTYMDISLSSILFSNEKVQDAISKLLKSNSNLEKLKYTGSQKDKISVIFQSLAKKKQLTEIQMNLNEITPNPPAPPSADYRNQSSIDAAKCFSSMYPWSLKVLLINFAPYEKQPIDNASHLIIPFLQLFSTFPLLERVFIFESKLNCIKYIQQICVLNLQIVNDQDVIDAFHPFSEKHLQIQQPFELDMTLHGMTVSNANDPIETGVQELSSKIRRVALNFMSSATEFCFRLNLETELRNERFFEVKKNNQRLFWKEGKERASVVITQRDTDSNIWGKKPKENIDNGKKDQIIVEEEEESKEKGDNHEKEMEVEVIKQPQIITNGNLPPSQVISSSDENQPGITLDTYSELRKLLILVSQRSDCEYDFSNIRNLKFLSWLCQYCPNLSKNTTLKFNSLRFYEGDLRCFRPLLKNVCGNVETLKLSFAQSYRIHNKGMVHALFTLQTLTTLQTLHLDFSRTSVRSKGIISLATKIPQLVSLRDLLLDFTDPFRIGTFNGKSMRKLLNSIGELRHLVALGLNFKYLKSKDILSPENSLEGMLRKLPENTLKTLKLNFLSLHTIEPNQQVNQCKTIMLICQRFRSLETFHFSLNKHPLAPVLLPGLSCLNQLTHLSDLKLELDIDCRENENIIEYYDFLPLLLKDLNVFKYDKLEMILLGFQFQRKDKDVYEFNEVDKLLEKIENLPHKLKVQATFNLLNFIFNAPSSAVINLAALKPRIKQLIGI